jgi:hypothetical protein
LQDQPLEAWHRLPEFVHRLGQRHPTRAHCLVAARLHRTRSVRHIDVSARFVGQQRLDGRPACMPRQQGKNMEVAKRGGRAGSVTIPRVI